MRKNRKPSVLVLVTALIFSFSIQLQGQQSAKGKSAENATTALLHMHSAYQQASAAQKPQLLTQFTAIAAQRQQLLSSLIQTNPGDVLRVAIPNEISQNMPSRVRGYVEQSVTAQGVLEVLYEMQGTPNRTTGTVLHHFLQTSTERLNLHFAASAPAHLLTGSVVRANGVRLNNDLVLASGTSSASLQTVTAAALPSTFGQFNTLVIMVNFQDNSSAQPFTASTVQNVVFNQTSNWDMENSFQQTSLTGTVAGWFTVAVNSSNCDMTSVKSYARSAAQSAGYNLSNYNRFIYLMSGNSGCSAWWGLATIGGSDVWVNGMYGISVKVVSHEMGHNFGLYHSHTTDCGTSVTCSSGTLSEYGDSLDTMGTPNAGHFNAFQKERLGWLNTSSQPPIMTVTSSGNYQISPYEVQDGNTKALKILQSGTSNSYYYVEFRQAQGQDSFLSNKTDVLNGVVVHLASPSNSNSSNLLDMTPAGPSSFGAPALTLGQSYTDSAAGITITPLSVSSTGATVQVTLGTAACTRANPTLSISPVQSSYVTAGTPVNFTATIKDNDGTSCAPSTFNLNDTPPSGWSGVWTTSGLSLSPGASGSATVTVMAPTGTPDGFYNIGVNVANAATPSYGTSATATYVISTPAPLSVAVATNQSIYSAGQSVTVTVTTLSGTSPDAGAGVSVSITPPSGRVNKQTGTTGSNGSVSFNYKLNKRAPSGTYQVQASTSSTSGAAATMGASTTFSVQ